MKKIILIVVIAVTVMGAYILFRNPGNELLVIPRMIDYIDFPAKDNASKFFTKIKTAVVSLPSYLTKEENIKKIEQIIDSATFRNPGLSLIVFGEASLGFYNAGKRGNKYIRTIAESIPGPFTQRMAFLAERFSIYIAAGLIEAKDGKFYNSLLVINPKGKIETVHRKMQLSFIDEQNGITSADPNNQVFEIEGVRFGLALGDDLSSRWLYNKYIESRIDVLISPNALTEISSFSQWLNCNPYSKLYKAWIINAGRYGIEDDMDFQGTVFISSPTGFMYYSDKPESNMLVHTIGK